MATPELEKQLAWRRKEQKAEPRVPNGIVHCLVRELPRDNQHWTDMIDSDGDVSCHAYPS